MTENDLMRELEYATDINSAYDAVMRFIIDGKATKAETIEVLRGVLEKALVPQYTGSDDGYDEWYDKNIETITATRQRVLRILQPQGRNVAMNEDIPIDELQTVYELCFDDVLYAMCNGPKDEAEARDWILEAFESGKAINAYANAEGVVQ